MIDYSFQGKNKFVEIQSANPDIVSTAKRNLRESFDFVHKNGLWVIKFFWSAHVDPQSVNELLNELRAGHGVSFSFCKHLHTH